MTAVYIDDGEHADWIKQAALRASGEFGDLPGHPFHGNQWTAGYEDIARAAGHWQGNPGYVDAMQDAADKLMMGEKLPLVPADYESGARALMSGIEHAPPTTMPLFRGIMAPNDPNWKPHTAKESPYHEGQVTSFSLGSFTEHAGWAQQFAGGATSATNTGTPIMFELAPGAKALSIDPLVDSRTHPREHEWVTGGKFEVTNVERWYAPSLGHWGTQSGFKVSLRQLEAVHA